MPDLETPDADAAEQQQGTTVGTDDVADLEAPDADAAEQSTLVRPALAPDASAPSPSRDPEADAADVAEQDAVVDYDDDDYR